MFQHNFDPVALSIGPISIYWYGLVYASGFLFLYWYLSRFNNELTGEAVDDYLVWAILGMLAGSRLFTFTFWYPDQLLVNPLRFFAIWQGGMSFHGGFAGMTVATWLFTWRRNLDFYDIADHIVVPAGVFLGLGRMANFINAELIGTPYNGAWCVSYPAERMQALGLTDVCRHPYQVYAAVKNAALTPLLYTANIVYALPSGTLFWGFTWLYSVARILVDTYRVEPSIILGLSMGQLLSLVFAAVSSYMLIRVHQHNE